MSHVSSLGYLFFFSLSIVLINVGIGSVYMRSENPQLIQSSGRSLTQDHRASRGRMSTSTRFVRTFVRTTNTTLDFVIAGFPKCGTTTLLFAFAGHEETEISPKEKCSFTNPQLSDKRALHKIDKEALAELSESKDIQRGLKCPNGIKNSDSIERLYMHSPRAKIFVGVRHPILFFQSYYNYRVMESHSKSWNDKIPTVDSFLVDSDWRGVSTRSSRFELVLMQLGKTNMSTSEFSQLLDRPHMGVQPNQFKIFLYALEQMEDPDEVRAFNFRRELGTFLGLKQNLRPFGHENDNRFVAQAGYNETIDICAATFKPLRDLLVAQGQITSKWILEAFMQSEDVTVANRDHFKYIMLKWNSDPCVDTNSSKF